MELFVVVAWLCTSVAADGTAKDCGLREIGAPFERQDDCLRIVAASRTTPSAHLVTCARKGSPAKVAARAD